MKIIEEALQPTDGYINLFKRDTLHGWWEIEIGIPRTWVFDENDEIKCEILTQNEIGKLIKVSPRNSDIVIDDLVKFVEIIIQTNQKIAEKEKEFTDKMEEMKKQLEEEAKHFYQELDELKASSFKKINDNFVKEKKETRGRKPKDKSEETKESTTE